VGFTYPTISSLASVSTSRKNADGSCCIKSLKLGSCCLFLPPPDIAQRLSLAAYPLSRRLSADPIRRQKTVRAVKQDEWRRDCAHGRTPRAPGARRGTALQHRLSSPCSAPSSPASRHFSGARSTRRRRQRSSRRSFSRRLLGTSSGLRRRRRRRRNSRTSLRASCTTWKVGHDKHLMLLLVCLSGGRMMSVSCSLSLVPRAAK